MSGFEIDQRTQSRQALASDPTRSAWVAANAGSGKTFVLARRVIRLLLSGADPSKILCLTFTKSAAAEMSARIFNALGKWTTLDEAILAREIEELIGEAADQNALNKARQLFAKALETPGGLKIQTIHAFCERLLHQFPVEAGIAGHFEVLDDVTKHKLINEARRSILLKADEQPMSTLNEALKVATAHASEKGYNEALSAYLEKHRPITDWLVKTGGVQGAKRELADFLGVSDNETIADLDDQLLKVHYFDRPYLESLRQALLSSSNKFRKMGQMIDKFFLPHTLEERRDALSTFFFKENGDRRKVGGIASKKIQETFFDLDERINLEQIWRERLVDKKNALIAVEATHALLTLGSAVCEQYQRLKARAGVMDFDDLIERTADLLEKPNAAAWVHFKLDQGLDHILLDEAQDTSPRQWDIICSLAEEFFTGESARIINRTLFAVGDEKQSIYSFQGASPEKFAIMRQHFMVQAKAAHKRFELAPLTLSFRSTADILGAVDLVFEKTQLSKELTDEYNPHTAARFNQPGFVEIWPAFKAPEKPDHLEEWWKPLDIPSHASEKVALAQALARKIKTLTNGKTRLTGTGEIITAGDILVLTRKRGSQVDAINRALKAERIAVAGSDRLKLLDHIAVLDLLALADFLLLSEDDLALAGVLKSPLIGLSEDDLFALCNQRGGTLWNTLFVQANAHQTGFTAAYETLNKWRLEADFVPPYDLFLNILSRDRARQRFIAALGRETEEVLEAFLLQVLTFEESNVPSLQGFVSWFRQGSIEIKRDLEAGRDEVRVMTVHAAKGLEAPIVFLIDGGTPYHTAHQPTLLSLNDEDSPPVIWKSSKKYETKQQNAALERDKEAALAEYYRLLYVAMTRARDQLYMLGTASKAGKPVEKGWYSIVSNALVNSEYCRKITAQDGTVSHWQWQISKSVGIDEKTVTTKKQTIYRPPLWLNQKASAPPAAIARLTPSNGDAEPIHSSIHATREIGGKDLPDIDPKQRGIIMHRLLERLPDLPEALHDEIAERYLKGVLGDTSAQSRQLVKREVLAVLTDQKMRALFNAKKAYSEVSVAGHIIFNGKSTFVSGQIDRLLLTEDTVHIIDFKTHRQIVGATLERDQIIRQLTLYKKLLTPLYPRLNIKTSILWTSIPKLELIEPNKI